VKYATGYSNFRSRNKSIMKGEINGKREKNKKKTLLAKILSEINK
jgi:hypothetical protein